IDLSKYHDEISKSDARKQLGVPADSFLVGHLGRFVYIKNQRFLIDVFIEVLKYNKNAFLVMVGDGHDLKSIKNKLKQNGIENKYLILSHVDNLIWFYKALDVFVFPSLFEGIPNACIEAQAAGLKCLISSTITKDVFFSPQAIPANLADGPKAWANLIVDNNSKGPYLNNIEEFDFSKISSTIGKLYSE
ncbi:MAG: glycosyltransferase, partial [Aeriscardovia sp.]|nr:glycosyltransferase [Aeriscardovia sp.]